MRILQDLKKRLGRCGIPAAPFVHRSRVKEISNSSLATSGELRGTRGVWRGGSTQKNQQERCKTMASPGGKSQGSFPSSATPGNELSFKATGLCPPTVGSRGVLVCPHVSMEPRVRPPGLPQQYPGEYPQRGRARCYHSPGTGKQWKGAVVTPEFCRA